MTGKYYEFIIIGAGIGGLQAASILAAENRSFIILQATQKLGGRIATDILGDVIANLKLSTQQLEWMTRSSQRMQVAVDYGATWISNEHSYMLKTIQHLGIKTYPQYFDGLTIYGVSQQQYERVESLIDYYKNYKNEIQRLLNKIDNIKNSLETLMEQSSSLRPHSDDEAGSTPLLNRKYSLLSEYIDYYDTLTVKQFIRNQLQNEFLADQILNEIEMLQCMSCDKFNMIQLVNDDGSLELLKVYCEKVENTIDGMKIKGGMISVINAMFDNMMEKLEQFNDNLTTKDVIKFNSPVNRIENEIGQDIRVYTKDNEVYTGGRVLFSVPIAVAHQIQITKISPSKQLIFENQEHGNVTRLYMVFESAFWRGKYSGYGSFSAQFPFSQMTDLSPANLAVGILVFIFVGDKFTKWVSQNPSQPQREQYLKGIIANIFLRGQSDSQCLKHCFSYVRCFAQNPYIRAAYQATTKPQIWKQIKRNGDDYVEAYSRDEYGVIYIGSQFAKQHPTYMEGALRLSRQKTYKLLQKEDPWAHDIRS